MTPLQRRSMVSMGCILLLTVITNFVIPKVPNPLMDLFPGLQQFLLVQTQTAGWVAVLIASVSVVPLLLAIWVMGCYLAAEPDEFVRMLVTRALLWGFALAMVGNAFVNALMNVYNHPFPLTILDADLFFFGSAVSFRLMQWIYR